MFLPRLVGSLPRRPLQSHVPLYPRPSPTPTLSRLSSSVEPSPHVSVDFGACKLLNAKKKRPTLHRRQLSDLYRTDIISRAANLNRKLKSLSLKKSHLESKRIAFETKTKAAAKLSKVYNFPFKRSELHTMTYDQLEQLAQTSALRQTRDNASRLIQQAWRRHRIARCKQALEDQLQKAAKVIQSHWRHFKVRPTQTEVLEPRQHRLTVESNMTAVQRLVRGKL